MSKTQNHQGETVPPDRRRDLRAPLITLKIQVEGEKKVFFGYAKNISCSGLFIATASPRNPGDRFSLEIPLPPPINRQVRVNCEVIWKRSFSARSSQEPGMGLKFLDLDQETAQALEDWISRQER